MPRKTKRQPRPMDLRRAAYLLRVAALHVETHASEGQTYYDEAHCDGMCLSDDLLVAASAIDGLSTDYDAEDWPKNRDRFGHLIQQPAEPKRWRSK